MGERWHRKTVFDGIREKHRDGLTSSPDFRTLVDDTRKAGRTVYDTRIVDDMGGRWLRIRVREQMWGSIRGYEMACPYQTHAQLLALLEKFKARPSRRPKIRLADRLAAWARRRTFTGYLGAIDNHAPNFRRFDAYLAVAHTGERLFVIRNAPSEADGPQVTYWVTFPFECVDKIIAKLKSP